MVLSNHIDDVLWILQFSVANIVSFFIEKVVSGGQKDFLNMDIYFIEAATRGVL